MDLEEVVMTIIGGAGEAKSFCYQALEHASMGDIQQAWSDLNEAGDRLTTVHQVHCHLLQSVAELPSDSKMLFLLSHAEDIFMTTMTEKELITSLLRSGIFDRKVEKAD